MALRKLTAERARELLDYDPDTGLLTWRVDHVSARAGTQAGRLLGGYLTLYIDGESGYPAHRVAWLIVHGRWPEHTIDHINRVKTDNRLANLRDVTMRVNAQNRGPLRGNSERAKTRPRDAFGRFVVTHPWG